MQASKERKAAFACRAFTSHFKYAWCLGGLVRDTLSARMRCEISWPCLIASIGLCQTALLDLRSVKLHSSCIRYSSKHRAPRSGISTHVPKGCVDLKNAVIGHAQARLANVTQLFCKVRWPALTQTQPPLYMQMCLVRLAYCTRQSRGSH